MDKLLNGFEKLCHDMEKNPHIMNIEEALGAAATGAGIGFKYSQTPEGVLIGATAGLAVEATERAAIMTKNLLQRQYAEYKKNRARKKP